MEQNADGDYVLGEVTESECVDKMTTTVIVEAETALADGEKLDNALANWLDALFNQNQ